MRLRTFQHTCCKIMSPSAAVQIQNALPDQRVFAPAAGRNKQPILEVLKSYLGHASRGHVLEVACGTGGHTALFAQAMPSLTFQPTDCTSDLFASISAHTAGLTNVLPPQILDASLLDEQVSHVISQAVQDDTSGTSRQQPQVDSSSCSISNTGIQRGLFAAIICINMTHISPFSATQGLLKGAGKFSRAYAPL